MAAAGESSSSRAPSPLSASLSPLSPPRLRWRTVGKPGRLIFGHCRALVRDPDALLPPSHLPPDDVAIVKRIVVLVVLVLVFVVRARAEVRNHSQQGRSNALPRHHTGPRRHWHGGGGGRGGARRGIFIAAGVVVPSISGGGGGVHCCPRRRDEDARVITLVAGVVANVNGTAIAVAATATIVVFVVLTDADTTAIAAAAAQPLLPLTFLFDCCLLEVLKCFGVDVIEGLAESQTRSGVNETSNVVNINQRRKRGVDDDDNDDDNNDDDTINDGGGTAIPNH